MKPMPRTDLAAEANALFQKSAADTSALPGVSARDEILSGFPVTTVEILDDAGAEALCKPKGKYLSLELDNLLHRRENAFENAALALSELLKRFSLPPEGDIVCACLGNPDITPDAVGPIAAQNVVVTRHLKRSLPQDFAAFRSVAVVRPGVLGTCGIESAEAVRAFCAVVSPALVVVVDALAAADFARLGRTVQLTDTGIAPGSGVGNDRAALNAGTLGVPVLAVGVPTVVDAGEGLFVTPRTVDDLVRRTGKLIGYAVNLALHNGITCGDVDLLLE